MTLEFQGWKVTWKKGAWKKFPSGETNIEKEVAFPPTIEVGSANTKNVPKRMTAIRQMNLYFVNGVHMQTQHTNPAKPVNMEIRDLALSSEITGVPLNRAVDLHNIKGAIAAAKTNKPDIKAFEKTFRMKDPRIGSLWLSKERRKPPTPITAVCRR